MHHKTHRLHLPMHTITVHCYVQCRMDYTSTCHLEHITYFRVGGGEGSCLSEANVCNAFAMHFDESI